MIKRYPNSVWMNIRKEKHLYCISDKEKNNIQQILKKLNGTKRESNSSNIRLLMNKVTKDNYKNISKCILNELYEHENKDEYFKIIIDTMSISSFYSHAYSEIFIDIMNESNEILDKLKYEIKDILNMNISKKSDDYDLFCESNKLIHRRNALLNIYMNVLCMSNSYFDAIIYLDYHINLFKKTSNENVFEVICVLLSNETLLDSICKYNDKDKLIKEIKHLTSCKVENKLRFKMMDIYDNLNKK